MVGTVRLLVWVPAYLDSASLVVGGVVRGGPGNRHRGYPVIEASSSHNWTHDCGVRGIKLSRLVDAHDCEPVWDVSI